MVLSDEKLRTFYEINDSKFESIEEAISSENPIVVTVAKIIRGVNNNLEKGNYKEVYNEIVSYLNQNML
ncbi:MAG: hypothetical protein JSR97_09390 [Verrucomicrobia bacterium]|nr:hypothetical protein [Verrucomicrobiota bacterium]